MNAVTAAAFHLQCVMVENTGLLPWMLGGLLTLGAVAAIAGGLSDPTSGGALTALNPAASTSTARAVPGAAPAAHSAAPADPSPVVVSTNARRQLPPGHVWECDFNGQRVFSDTQCGKHATVRQLTEPNVFDSNAAYGRGTSRPYGNGPAPGYYPQPLPTSETPPEDSDGGDPIYTQVIVLRDQRRDPLAHHGNHPHPRAGHP
jgi:hypothetical protein